MPPVSMHWTPRRPTVELKPSRIRRKHVLLAEAVEAPKPRTAVRTREQEMWGSIAGVLLIATVIVIAIAGIAIATIFHDDPAAAASELRYDQCYTGRQNCVIDGGTIRVSGEKIAIAGVDAPAIQGSACADERGRGIDSAVRLANFLNSGNVTVSPPFRDEYGREVRKVEVKGEDVGHWLIAAGLAREYLGQHQNWCSAAS
jgi:micrococcal nuclease